MPPPECESETKSVKQYSIQKSKTKSENPNKKCVVCIFCTKSNRTTAAAGGEERLGADGTDAETRRAERHWFRRGLSILVVVERRDEEGREARAQARRGLSQS